MINLKTARQVIAAAEAKADEIGQPMNIAVVDAGGNLLSHVRMDGAWIGSIDISINKAFTARAFDISTAQLSENSQPGQQFYGIQNSNHGRIMIFAGGVHCGTTGRSSAPSESVAAVVVRIKRSRPPALQLFKAAEAERCAPAQPANAAAGCRRARDA
jgi:uncharacterized protein GlcG (DUF336 family)